MALNVFISYSGNDGDEQAVVWRLQTLAAAQGIQVYVPTRTVGRHPGVAPSGNLKHLEKSAIDDADIVLAIITSKTSRAVENELGYALQREKLIVPIVQRGIQLPPLFHRFRVFHFSPSTLPGALETEIVGYLEEQKLSKERLRAAGAVIAVGLALLLLSAVANE